MYHGKHKFRYAAYYLIDPFPPIPWWRRLRAGVARWAALLTLRSPVHPPIVGDVVLQTAEAWLVEVGK